MNASMKSYMAILIMAAAVVGWFGGQAFGPHYYCVDVPKNVFVKDVQPRCLDCGYSYEDRPEGWTFCKADVIGGLCAGCLQLRKDQHRAAVMRAYQQQMQRGALSDYMQHLLREKDGR